MSDFPVCKLTLPHWNTSSHLQSHKPCPVTLTVSQALPYPTYSLTSPAPSHSFTSPAPSHLQSYKPHLITHSLTSPALSHLQSHKPCPITFSLTSPAAWHLRVSRFPSHCPSVACWLVHAGQSQFDSRHTNGVSVLKMMDHIWSANTCLRFTS